MTGSEPRQVLGVDLRRIECFECVLYAQWKLVSSRAYRSRRVSKQEKRNGSAAQVRSRRKLKVPPEVEPLRTRAQSGIQPHFQQLA